MTPTEEELRLVRHFAENSVKFLMHDRDNVREALTLMAPAQAPLIDFERLTVLQNTFVAPSFRHLITDILLRAPLRATRAKGKRQVYVYQLIEHQSEPDDLATYRAIRYVMEVFDLQVQQWQQEHGNLRDLRFDPVLPVVIYTGTRTWGALTPMRELVDHGSSFAKQTPEIEPVFFNLATTSAEKLHDEAGLFGRVLHLMQQRNAKKTAFRALLGEVVEHVDRLPKGDQGRWHDLLWYLRAMVYHVRERQEHQPLVESIEHSARSQSRQKEVSDMGQTMAEFLLEKGKTEGVLKGKQELLLYQLKDKFPKLPAWIEARVRATNDETKLEAWSKELLRVDELAEMSLATK